jgi:hypothetical protein
MTTLLVAHATSSHTLLQASLAKERRELRAAQREAEQDAVRTNTHHFSLDINCDLTNSGVFLRHCFLMPSPLDTQLSAAMIFLFLF